MDINTITQWLMCLAVANVALTGWLLYESGQIAVTKYELKRMKELLEIKGLI